MDGPRSRNSMLHISNLWVLTYLFSLLSQVHIGALHIDFEDDCSIAPIFRRDNTSYLDTLSLNQRRLFSYTMVGLDLNFGPPFLVSPCCHRRRFQP